MKTQTLVTALAGLALAGSASAQLGLGDTIGIDFASPGAVFPAAPPATLPPAAGTNFNAFDAQTLDTATAAFAGTLIDLDGDSHASVGFSVTNNTGKDSNLTGIAGGGGPAPFGDISISEDNYGVANVGNAGRADFGTITDESNFVFTFSGLDDNLSYNVTGGYLHGTPNDNFNTLWEIDGQSASTLNTSGLADAGYMTLTGLNTDGGGNLAITVKRDAVQLFVAGLTVTATPFVDPGDPADLDGDGDVDDADFGIAFAAFTGPNNGPSSNPDADLDGDGDVDDADFGIAFAAFTGPNPGAVPEPASLALLGLGGLLVARRRRA